MLLMEAPVLIPVFDRGIERLDKDMIQYLCVSVSFQQHPSLNYPIQMLRKLACHLPV